MTLPMPIDDQAQPADLEDAWERLSRHARDVDNDLRGQPSLEVLTVEIDPASLPRTVLCETPTANVRGVARVGTVSTLDSSIVTNTDLGWRQASDVGGQSETGFEVTSLPGCSSGTTYAVTFHVTGEHG